MRLVIFEDRTTTQFWPLTLTRPVFELICGEFSVRERWIRNLPVSSWGVSIRSYLAEFYAEQFPEAVINNQDWLGEGRTLILNGRWIPGPTDLLSEPDPLSAGMIGDVPAYFTIEADEAQALRHLDVDQFWPQLLGQRRPVPVGGHLLCRPWDLVEHNAEMLRSDFHLQNLGNQFPEASPYFAVLGPSEQIHIDPTATLDPYVVVDSRKGPVHIGPGTLVQSFTRIEGPCFIGEGTILARAILKGGSTIGPHCRIGGEIEKTIVHGYSNKFHDGFLGHSYIGSWVNLGAQTCNSDLKNDYSAVRVPINGHMVDSGLTKVGCFIGDHTKTSINCQFNTGSSIGVMCQLMASGGLLPRQIPSFCSTREGRVTPGLDIERMMGAARLMQRRRNRDLSGAEERLLRFLYLLTRKEREDAITRALERQHQRDLSSIS